MKYIYIKTSLIILLIWCAGPALATTAHHHATQQTHKKNKVHTAKHVTKKTHKKISHQKVNKKNKKIIHHPVIKQAKERAPLSIPTEITDTSPVVSMSEKTSEVTTSTSPSPSPSIMNSMSKRLVGFVRNTVETLRYSVYKLGGTNFNFAKGIYVVDCSAYVDRILESVYPHAYSSLVDYTGSEKPTTQHYYDFINGLAEEPQNDWNKIEAVNDLQAGDILVFRYKNSIGNQTGGHVMVVMDKPIRDTNVYFVRVADSAPTGHSHDTREPNYSGIGIGTLLLKTNPKTGHPLAFAWGVGSYWNKNVNFAMARPVELT